MGTVVLSRPLGRPIHTGGKEFVIPAGEENLRRDGIADELFFLFFFFLADPLGRVCRRFVDMSIRVRSREEEWPGGEIDFWTKRAETNNPWN